MSPVRDELRLVVFDWDGTLIDSIGTILACTHAMLDELELPHPPVDRILSMIGMGLTDSVRILSNDGDEEVQRQVVETYRRLWFGRFHHRPLLMDATLEVVADLEATGLLLAVATAKSRAGLRADLERTGLDGRFHASRTADESAPKPSPTMLLEILDELGVRASQTLMVGDSIHDVRMAQSAEVAVVAVSSGAQSESSLRSAGPLDCLPSVAELPAWLDDSGRSGPGGRTPVE